ncbi:hypothetical protein ANCCAN_02609 [Ancylostoma caninum]|uniref:Uncharacterized protein n=1 Tax=Ancylostoma caninum TaxID=29170 RepID=A0A368H657_ANCCA|nr:hypothetical protein ANCCAN_02609 [Ancylostoma caninum]
MQEQWCICGLSGILALIASFGVLSAARIVEIDRLKSSPTTETKENTSGSPEEVTSYVYGIKTADTTVLV